MGRFNIICLISVSPEKWLPSKSKLCYELIVQFLDIVLTLGTVSVCPHKFKLVSHFVPNQSSSIKNLDARNLVPVFYINQARDILRPRTVPVNWRQILHYAQRLPQQNPICWDKMCSLAVSNAISAEADNSSMPTLISYIAKIYYKKKITLFLCQGLFRYEKELIFKWIVIVSRKDSVLIHKHHKTFT